MYRLSKLYIPIYKKLKAGNDDYEETEEPAPRLCI